MVVVREVILEKNEKEGLLKWEEMVKNVLHIMRTELNGTARNFQITVTAMREAVDKVVITHIAATWNQRKNYSTQDHTCDARLDFYLVASMPIL